jgi:hypothetical protein
MCLAFVRFTTCVIFFTALLQGGYGGSSVVGRLKFREIRYHTKVAESIRG